MMLEVIVGIVVYNSRDTIIDTINSVALQTYKKCRLIVLDNCSADNCGDLINKHPAVDEYIYSARNLGFSGGHNEIIRRFPAKYYFCLNPDVVLEEDYLDLLVAQAERENQAGSLTGKLYRLNSNQEKVIDTVGHVMSYGIHCTNIGSGSADLDKFDDGNERFGVCAAASLYTPRAIKAISDNKCFFDETYFAYWEDVDVDWRISCAGFKALYVPQALAYHARGAVENRTEFVTFLGKRNRYIFVQKYRPQFKSLWNFLFYYSEEIYTLLYSLFKPGARQSVEAKREARKLHVKTFEKKPGSYFLNPPYFYLNRRETRRLLKQVFTLAVITYILLHIF